MFRVLRAASRASRSGLSEMQPAPPPAARILCVKLITAPPRRSPAYSPTQAPASNQFSRPNGSLTVDLHTGAQRTHRRAALGVYFIYDQAFQTLPCGWALPNARVECPSRPPRAPRGGPAYSPTFARGARQRRSKAFLCRSVADRFATVRSALRDVVRETSPARAAPKPTLCAPLPGRSPTSPAYSPSGAAVRFQRPTQHF